jgi:hypothetical protein
VTISHYRGITYLVAFLWILISLLMIPLHIAHAASGSIQSLTATSAPNPGDTFTVTAVLEAEGKINNSSLHYQIIAPDGLTVVLTHTTDLPSLDDELYTDTWSGDNTAFPSTGNYTVVLCWSRGGSQNCNVASATTTFYSAPTLGPWFGLAALGVAGVFIWRKRADFRQQGKIL